MAIYQRGLSSTVPQSTPSARVVLWLATRRSTNLTSGERGRPLIAFRVAAAASILPKYAVRSQFRATLEALVRTTKPGHDDHQTQCNLWQACTAKNRRNNGGVTALL